MRFARWLSFYWNYPFTKFLRLFEEIEPQMTHEIRGVVFQVFGVGFTVLWRKRRS